MYADTAWEVWLDLKERYSQGNGPRVFQLQKAIAALTQDQLSANTNYTRLWEEWMNHNPLPECQMDCPRGICDEILDGTPWILLKCEKSNLDDRALISINNGYSIALQEEKQREIGTGGVFCVEPTALFINANGKSNHGTQNSCKEKPVCTYHGISGHVTDNHYNLHSYTPS